MELKKIKTKIRRIIKYNETEPLAKAFHRWNNQIQLMKLKEKDLYHAVKTIITSAQINDRKNLNYALGTWKKKIHQIREQYLKSLLVKQIKTSQDVKEKMNNENKKKNDKTEEIGLGINKDINIAKVDPFLIKCDTTKEYIEKKLKEYEQFKLSDLDELNANIIKSVDELAKLKDGNECYMSNGTKLNEIEGNYFYYYRYNSGEIVNGNNYESKLKIEQIKVTINNSRVSEESTGKIIESTFGQCN